MDADRQGGEQPPALPEAEFVETERIDAAGARVGGGEFGAPGGIRVQTFGFAAQGASRPPRLWTWVFLLAAWFFLGSRIPFTVFIGVPLNLAALILATICLTRGGLFTGILALLLGTGGSFMVYLVGLFRFLGA